jgi:ATP-dependent Clp protease ATP-binding subunit ClpA
VIQREVVDRVASAILEGDAPEDSVILVDLVDQEIEITVRQPAAATPE